MFKKLSLLALTIFSAASQANELSDPNLVTRSLTAKDGEIQIHGAAGYAKNDDDNTWYLGLDGRYGITDDWSIALGHTRYRFWDRGGNKTGLELTFGAGLKGVYEQKGADDTIGYGADITGKYVFSRDTALIFGSQYVFWNVPDTDKNRDEWKWSVGVQRKIFSNLVLSANYSFKDLNDFEQSDAHEASLSFNYSLTRQFDVGLSFGYSDFDPIKNGYTSDSAYEQSAGLYVGYRF